MADTYFVKKKNPNDITITLAGNPNVGKTTVFNALTGMNQHTGNWAGKTVETAVGYCKKNNKSYTIVDIPGTYSLMAHSAEEEVARNFLCFGGSDITVVVCDATNLERNMNLVLQTLEICKNVILCVNFLDEAKEINIRIDLKKLSARLGIPIIGISARKKKNLRNLLDEIDNFAPSSHYEVRYPETIEKIISIVEPFVPECGINPRWLALRLLDRDMTLENEISNIFGKDFLSSSELTLALSKAKKILDDNSVTEDILSDEITKTLIETSKKICDSAVTKGETYKKSHQKADKIITGKITAYPVMLALLAFIFWLTVSAANYPSKLLSDLLFSFQDKLSLFFININAPQWLHDALVMGVYRVLAWVVSVMLPPMAIFFPLFALLENSGFLPRIAYNLDKPFILCNACGKQALTMCMGFGCNAVGITGCRIIDSPRERLLAILTNSLVPCNGRFPSLITVITLFFIGTSSGLFSSVKTALILTAIIALSISVTFLATKFLSETILKGEPSSFTLELPPYRKPEIIKTVIRSLFDKTLAVLLRAIAVAAPAGFFIWLFANFNIGGASIISYISDFLNPFARLMGLDGAILTAFILGLPANETVIPIMLMIYCETGTLPDISSNIGVILTENGWTVTTATCFILFSLMHFPCSTSLLTIKKETGSIKHTLLAAILPTVMGIIACMVACEVMRVII